MIKIIIVIGFISFGFSQKYEIKNGTATFYAVAAVIGLESSFDGTGTSLNGYIDFNKKRLEFTYDLWDLKTGIDLRDDHMHENYLETEKYPKATFRGSIIKNENNFVIVTGLFELHGIKQKLTVNGKILDNTLTATWDLRLSDFGIETPRRFLVAKISSTLKMAITCQLTEIK